MNQDTKIEFYLLQLDRDLQPLSVSQRAEIITEIKSHIRDSMEKDPGRPVDDVLRDLGSARTVADRYLAFKGVSRGKPASGGGRRVLKWLAVGTVAFFGLIFVAGLMTIWYFSPLIKVDQARGHVQLFGGLVDVNEELGQVKVGDIAVNEFNEDSVKSEGAQDTSLQGVKKILIPFNTAKLVISASLDKQLKWECNAASKRAPKVDVTAGVLTLNLDVLSLAKCEIFIPRGMKTEMHGVNGHMDVRYPHDDLTIALDNGRVAIHPDPARNYDFDVRVKNGLQDTFPRSAAKDAVKVKVSVVNGLVKKDYRKDNE